MTRLLSYGEEFTHEGGRGPGATIELGLDLDLALSVVHPLAADDERKDGEVTSINGVEEFEYLDSGVSEIESQAGFGCRSCHVSLLSVS
ncbi:hypothetical protein GCM10009535_57760 [Streptomyces thermocarboxydovorans]|uniref:Uncharacterized protein n=1 Tax=Streptomyces thermocarboxydovorans TaxID=59298 RepID=A0ABP3SYZ4_9ACTN